MSDDCQCEEGAPAWMATFSDLATLLLTFFVLLLSFAELNVTQFKQMLGSVREAFGVQFETAGSHEALSTSPVSMDGRQPQTIDDNQEAEEELQARIEELGLEAEVDIESDVGGVTVRIRDRVLFESGSADLDEDSARGVLPAIVTLGRELSRELAVHGHSDDRPIQSARYPSNWELSSARASSVVRFLLAEGLLDEMDVSIAGWADTKPLVPNDSPENRAINRRVEFRFVTRREVELATEAETEVIQDAAPVEATP